MNIQAEIINLTILMTAVTGAILLIKGIFKNKISPRGHILMWALVVVLLVSWPMADVMPELDFSARNFVPQISVEDYAAEEAVIDVTIYKSSFKGMAADYGFRQTIFNVWGVGSLIALSALIVIAVRDKYKFSRLKFCTNEMVLDSFDRMKESAGIRRKIGLKTGSKSVMLEGIFSPAVYLTDSFEEDMDNLDYVFAHELTHYRHGDLVINLFSGLILCAFWWNLVIWAGYERLRLDMEVYCDWDAVKLVEDKKGYARMLVGAARGNGELFAFSTSLVNRESQVSKRIKALVYFKTPERLAAAAAVIILIFTGTAIAAVPSASEIPPAAGSVTEESETSLSGSEVSMKEAVLLIEDNFSLLSGVTEYDNGMGLVFDKTGEDNIWGEAENVPEIYVKWDNGVNVRIKRCTAGFGELILGGIKEMSSGIVTDYQLYEENGDVTCSLSTVECTALVTEEEDKMVLAFIS